MITLDLNEFKLEIERLSIRLESFKKQTDTNLLAFSGMLFLSHNLNISDKHFENYWIVNFGAADRITTTFKHFHAYALYSSNKKFSQ